MMNTERNTPSHSWKVKSLPYFCRVELKCWGLRPKLLCPFPLSCETRNESAQRLILLFIYLTIPFCRPKVGHVIKSSLLHRFVPLRFIVASVKTNLIRIFLPVVVAATANGYHLCVCSVRKVLPRKIETKESSVYECKKWFWIIPREVIVSVLVAENDAVSTANRSGGHIKNFGFLPLDNSPSSFRLVNKIFSMNFHFGFRFVCIISQSSLKNIPRNSAC